MSEYQYYEFLAIDHPLDERQQAAVRSLSTRARITATSFINEYHWGDFSGDPNRLMERYYDAHVHVTNWGTRRLMFRLPRHVLDLDKVEDYRVGHHLSAWTADEFLVLDMTSEDDDEDFEFNYEADARLSATVGVRAELAAGDLRPLYLAWLAGYGVWERDEDAFEPDADQRLEPPVPPGLGTLTAPQRAFADFLRLDDELLASAARTSPPFADTADDLDRLTAWVKKLPLAEKNELLSRVVQEPGATVRMELLRRFRDIHTTTAAAPRRTVADVLDSAARLRAEKV
ncbi:hypothetical protein ACFWMR_14810 [Amycolatopsis thailandensis]|uniref:hypothetical protein n=1 Tax=Amycolatopsis thailandensis TaxID=589330 RepID=UPI00365F86AB